MTRLLSEAEVLFELKSHQLGLRKVVLKDLEVEVPTLSLPRLHRRLAAVLLALLLVLIFLRPHPSLLFLKGRTS